MRAGAGTLVVRVSALAVSMLSSIVLARALGAEGFGIYALAFSLLSLIGIPVQMGIPTLILRETSAGRATAAWGRVRAIWAWATRRILFMSVPALLIGLGLVFAFSAQQTWRVALIGAPLVPILALILVRDAAQRGLHRIVSGQLSDGLVRPGATLLLIALVWVVTGRNVTPTQAMAYTVLAGAIALACSTLLLRHHAPAALRAAEKAPDEAAWARAILPLAGIATVQILGENLGIVVLGALATPQDVAHFKIAQSANALAIIGLTVVSLVLAPRIADLHARNEHARLQRLVSLSAALSMAALLPLALILALWGEPLLGFLYGSEFLPAYPLLLVLLTGQLVKAFFGSVINALVMTGHERTALVGIAAGTATNLAVALILIPRIGAIGAAIASSIAMLVWNLMLWRGALRRTGIDSTVFGYLRRAHPA